MTQTLPGADIRGFYAALGVQLPRPERENVSVRCFTNADGHSRGDRDPSCSVNLTSGAWNCHGCGAAGGAYDAALALGLSERSGVDLLVRFGLAERRINRARGRTTRQHRASAGRPSQQPRPDAFPITEADITRWRAVLARTPALIERLAQERGWSWKAIRAFELGVDRRRITIPVRDEQHRLVGLLRYKPWPPGAADKMRAAVGSSRQLLPHPNAEPSEHVVLVEGEPDMLAARSQGLPAIAVPGVGCWRSDWVRQLADRDVAVVTDADPQGRSLAALIANDLAGHARVRIVDPDPGRDDGHDLTGWLSDDPAKALEALR